MGPRLPLFIAAGCCLATPFLLPGCEAAPPDLPAPLYEGDEAGECSDGADNDQDGDFDCDDAGCAGSPDCLSGDPPGDDDDSSGTGDDDSGDDDSGDDDSSANSGDDDSSEAPVALCDGVFQARSVPTGFAVYEFIQDNSDPDNCDPYPGWCTQPYLDFIDLAQDHGEPVTLSEIAATTEALGDQSQVEGPIDPDEFAASLIEAFNICFLLDDLDANQTEVWLYEETNYFDGITGYNMLITDPWVGDFRAMLLLPPESAGEGPFPTILAVHGHTGEASDFIWGLGGDAYAKAGYVFLAVDMRANFANQEELAIGLALYQAGFTLQGLHLYEILVARKYLASRADVDPERIALIGNSAGSMKGNGLIRITNAFSAYISDNLSGYISPYDVEEPGMQEDLVPAVYPYTELINDFSTSEVPVLTQPYGYPDGTLESVAFLNELLVDP